jgi:hypothetical protein
LGLNGLSKDQASATTTSHEHWRLTSLHAV